MSLESRLQALVAAIGADVKSVLSSLSGKQPTLTVKDEGTTLISGPSSIKFTGAGVTASQADGEVTVDIPGGASSADYSAVVVSVTKVDHGFTIGKFVGLFSNVWELHHGPSRPPLSGVVSKVVDADHFEVTTQGVVTGLTGVYAGNDLFASPHGAGVLSKDINYGTAIQVLVALNYDIRPVCWGMSSTSLVVFPYTPESPPIGAVGSGPETSVQTLWYMDVLYFELKPASASSAASLATHVSTAYADGTTYAIPIPPEGLSAVNPGLHPLEYLHQVTGATLSGASGSKVYLSADTPGGFTLTPPSIRQVVGVLDSSGVVRVVFPYIEAKPIHVGTTAPSDPAEGDVWIDTN